MYDPQILHLKSDVNTKYTSLKIDFKDPIIFKGETECALLDIQIPKEVLPSNYITVKDEYSVKYMLIKLNKNYEKRMKFRRDPFDRKELEFKYEFDLKYNDVQSVYEYLKSIIKRVNEKALEIVIDEFNNFLLEEESHEIDFDEDHISQDKRESSYTSIEPIHFIGKNDEGEYFLRRGIGRFILKLFPDQRSNVKYIDILHYYVNFGQKIKNILGMPDGFEDFPYKNNGKSDVNPYSYFGANARSWVDFTGPKLNIHAIDKPRYFYIICDILKSSYLRNKKTEILQSIYNNQNGSLKDIESPIYIPVKLREINSINIKICDINENIFPIKSGYFSFVLSFRPIHNTLSLLD